MRASAAAALLAGCGGGTAREPAVPPPQPMRTLQLSAVYLLAASGPPAADTTVTLVAGTPRHVLIRTAAPDRTVIADLYFDAAAFAATTSGAPVRLSVHPEPGRFELTIDSDTPFRGGGQITFKYSLHFLLPPGITDTYANDIVFARALAVGHLEPDGRITLLPSSRPAADNLTAAIAAPGTYVVAAPK